MRLLKMGMMVSLISLSTLTFAKTEACQFEIIADKELNQLIDKRGYDFKNKEKICQLVKKHDAKIYLSSVSDTSSTQNSASVSLEYADAKLADKGVALLGDEIINQVYVSKGNTRQSINHLKYLAAMEVMSQISEKGLDSLEQSRIKLKNHNPAKPFNDKGYWGEGEKCLVSNGTVDKQTMAISMKGGFKKNVLGINCDQLKQHQVHLRFNNVSYISSVATVSSTYLKYGLGEYINQDIPLFVLDTEATMNTINQPSITQEFESLYIGANQLYTHISKDKIQAVDSVREYLKKHLN